jgi:hypothetical protein
MGYTHYWTQTRYFTRDEWVQIREDFEALLIDVQHVQGIPLANGMGEPGTSPEIPDTEILVQRRRRRRLRDLLPVPSTAEGARGAPGLGFLQDGPQALRPGRHSGALLPCLRHRPDIPQRGLGRARARLP